MQIAHYRVFGSGSSWISARPLRPMTAAQIISRLLEIYKQPCCDDGHNGFVGTYSVPDDPSVHVAVHHSPPCNPADPYWPDLGQWQRIAAKDPNRVFGPDDDPRELRRKYMRED